MTFKRIKFLWQNPWKSKRKLWLSPVNCKVQGLYDFSENSEKKWTKIIDFLTKIEQKFPIVFTAIQFDKNLKKR